MFQISARLILPLAAALAAWPQQFHNPERVRHALPGHGLGRRSLRPEPIEADARGRPEWGRFLPGRGCRQSEGCGLGLLHHRRRINGYDWSKLPDDAEIRRNLTEVMNQGAGTGVLGFYLRDEPHASLMPPWAACRKCSRNCARQVAIREPVSIPRQQGAYGTPDYETYAKLLGTPSASRSELRQLLAGGRRDAGVFLQHLEVVRRVALETQTPFWNAF